MAIKGGARQSSAQTHRLWVDGKKFRRQRALLEEAALWGARILEIVDTPVLQQLNLTLLSE